MRPGWLPDGFEIVSTEFFINGTEIIMSDGFGNEIEFLYRSGDDIATVAAIDNEQLIIEETIINGTATFIVTSTHDDFKNGIVFMVVYKNSFL